MTCRRYKALYAAIPHQWYSNNPLQDYEGYYCSVIYSYFVALGYAVTAEDATALGRIDISVVIPNNKVLIFEFKVALDKDVSHAALH